MFGVCLNCGEYIENLLVIDAGEKQCICPMCNHRQSFEMLPLFIVTGASGTGKSTIALPLIQYLPECVVLESDLFLECVELNADTN